jgi:hypothetical protein
MTKYKVGDGVWVAQSGHRDVREVCPVCYGKLEVLLILGNGDKVTLPCDYCGKGYSSPTGYVTEYGYFTSAVFMTIDAVEVTATANGEEVLYHSDFYLLYPANVFDTKAEALTKGEELAAELAEQQRTRTEHIKADVKKSFTWNAGYHLREAKRKEAEAARHRERAKLCKAKAD